MEMRKTNTLCLQEKWIRDRPKTIVGERHKNKLWCSRQDINQIGVGVIMDERKTKDVVEVCKKKYMFIRVKIVLLINTCTSLKKLSHKKVKCSY